MYIFGGILALISAVHGFIGMEEIQVHILKAKQNYSFHGIISKVPHSSNIVLWFCDGQNGETDILQLLNIRRSKESYCPIVSDYKAMLIPFSLFEKNIKLEKNKEKLHQLTLTGRDKVHQLVISFVSQYDKEYTNELIEHIQEHLQSQTKIEDREELIELMNGMDDYLDSFCKKNHPLPVHELYNDDL